MLCSTTSIKLMRWYDALGGRFKIFILLYCSILLVDTCTKFVVV